MTPPDPTTRRFTFAIGEIGPSSAGDSGQYFLAEIIRSGSADDAQAQLISELTGQGLHLGEQLAFVTLLSTEDTDELGNDFSDDE